jgi:hypothetical protein
MKLYEDMLQTNIEAKNIHDLKDYIFILFYDTLPLKEHFNKLKMQNKEKKNQMGGDGENSNENEEGEEEGEGEEENDIPENREKANGKNREELS